MEGSRIDLHSDRLHKILERYIGMVQQKRILIFEDRNHRMTEHVQMILVRVRLFCLGMLGESAPGESPKRQKPISEL